MCQVRIDFESLQLQNAVRTSVPTTNQAGACVVDKLDFSTTSGDSFGPLCGTETDNSQHIYLGEQSLVYPAMTVRRMRSFYRSWIRLH